MHDIEFHKNTSDRTILSPVKFDLVDRYKQTRKLTEELCRPLATEDYIVQPNAEVSPPKWHLGHTTWFFEELILKKFMPNYKRHNQNFPLIFNSYYKSAGTHWLQSERGHLSRPTVEEVFRYRSIVDEKICELLEQGNDLNSEKLDFTLELGIHHEQQHQELLLMDIKSILSCNPAPPKYSMDAPIKSRSIAQTWKEYGEGIYQMGSEGKYFSYDNELPKHKIYCYPFAISQTLVSNQEFLSFIEDGGYCRPEFWLSKGWDWVQNEKVQGPLYWHKKENSWYEYTLYGEVPLDLKSPLVHISYFEADAFANWKKQRLPTEIEMESYLSQGDIASEPLRFHPIDVGKINRGLWCWTSSHYSPYPKFKKFSGLVKEYNGKFMCNQFVLRGGAMATPADHYRHSYRNFYEPHQRWMFSGIRLAKDI